MRALALSAPALQLDDLARVFDPTSLVLVEDLFQSDVLPHCSSGIFTTDLHGVVTLREYVETVAPLPTVDVMAVIVVATSVTRQDTHKASKARHINMKGRSCAAKSSRALEATKHGCTKKNQHEDTKCEKNLCRNNKRMSSAEDTAGHRACARGRKRRNGSELGERAQTKNQGQNRVPRRRQNCRRVVFFFFLKKNMDTLVKEPKPARSKKKSSNRKSPSRRRRVSNIRKWSKQEYQL